MMKRTRRSKATKPMRARKTSKTARKGIDDRQKNINLLVNEGFEKDHASFLADFGLAMRDLTKKNSKYPGIAKQYRLSHRPPASGGTKDDGSPAPCPLCFFALAPHFRCCQP
jgi:hypothetical protein